MFAMLNTGLAAIFGTLAGTIVDAIGFRDWVFMGSWLVAATPFVSFVGFSPWAMGRCVHVRACARWCTRASHACAVALSNTCGGRTDACVQTFSASFAHHGSSDDHLWFAASRCPIAQVYGTSRTTNETRRG